MPLPRPASPRALWSDLRAFAGERSGVKWIAAVFAILMPVVIVVGFIVDARTNVLPGEQVIYAECWCANRTASVRRWPSPCARLRSRCAED